MPGALLPKHVSMEELKLGILVGQRKCAKKTRHPDEKHWDISLTFTTEKSNKVPFKEKGSNSNGQIVLTGDFVQI